MSPRQPLRPFAPEQRRHVLAELGQGEDLLPVGLTGAERKAAAKPGLRDPPKERDMVPIVDSKWAGIAGAIATVLALLAGFAPRLAFLPAWAPFALWGLAALAAVLAGVALPPFEGTSPTVPVVLVPIFGAVATGLATLASTMVPGTLQSVVMLLAVVCAALAGKALPTVPKPDALRR